MKGYVGPMPLPDLTDEAQALESDLVGGGWESGLAHCTTILPVMWECTEQW